MRPEPAREQLETAPTTYTSGKFPSTASLIWRVTCETVRIGAAGMGRPSQQHVFQKLDGTPHVAALVVPLSTDDGNPAAVGALVEQRQQFHPIDLATSQRDFEAAAVDVANGVARLEMHDEGIEQPQRLFGLVASQHETCRVEIDAQGPGLHRG